jgi:hypothetical protein
MFARISSARREIGKRVLYDPGTKPSIPEKPGFIGAIWNFRSGSRSSGVHRRFM